MSAASAGLTSSRMTTWCFLILMPLKTGKSSFNIQPCALWGVPLLSTSIVSACKKYLFTTQHVYTLTITFTEMYISKQMSNCQTNCFLFTTGHTPLANHPLPHTHIFPPAEVWHCAKGSPQPSESHLTFTIYLKSKKSTGLLFF